MSARGYHVSILADSRVFVFGGFNGQDVYEDVHILDLAGSGYLAQVREIFERKFMLTHTVNPGYELPHRS